MSDTQRTIAAIIDGEMTRIPQSSPDPVEELIACSRLAGGTGQ